jgi:hypothetical protein
MENSMLKTLLIASAIVIFASPAFAGSAQHRPARGIRGLFLQAEPSGVVVPTAPAAPAMIFRDQSYTDPDPFIYYYLIRSYRGNALG